MRVHHIADAHSSTFNVHSIVLRFIYIFITQDDCLSINHNWCNGLNIDLMWTYLVNEIQHVENAIDNLRPLSCPCAHYNRMSQFLQGTFDTDSAGPVISMSYDLHTNVCASCCEWHDTVLRLLKVNAGFDITTMCRFIDRSSHQQMRLAEVVLQRHTLPVDHTFKSDVKEKSQPLLSDIDISDECLTAVCVLGMKKLNLMVLSLLQLTDRYSHLRSVIQKDGVDLNRLHNKLRECVFRLNGSVF